MKKEAIEALVALGYSASDATTAVKKVAVSEDSTVEGILKTYRDQFLENLQIISGQKTV